jgi:hypothetical protein
VEHQYVDNLARFTHPAILLTRRFGLFADISSDSACHVSRFDLEVGNRADVYRIGTRRQVIVLGCIDLYTSYFVGFPFRLKVPPEESSAKFLRGHPKPANEGHLKTGQR